MKRLITRLRNRSSEIRPATPAAEINRKRTYAYALFLVAGLTGLAWVNNSRYAAAAFLVALVLGLLWVAYAAHRALLTTGLAIIWWIATAPALGIFATSGLPETQVYLSISQATATNVGLGVVVWLTALLMRAPKPATTVMACWLLNTLVVVAASFVLPTAAWAVGYLVTLAVLAQRSGLLARMRNVRVARGEADPDDPAQLAVRDAFDRLPASLSVRYGLPLGEDGAGMAVVVGPTGTYAVHGMVTDALVRAVSGGTRLVAGGHRLDPEIRAAAMAAVRASELLRTPVRPVLVVAGNFAVGLARASIRPERDHDPLEVLVVRADLAADRLAHGQPVLTTGQCGRIVRRMSASTVDDKEPALAL